MPNRSIWVFWRESSQVPGPPLEFLIQEVRGLRICILSSQVTLKVLVQEAELEKHLVEKSLNLVPPSPLIALEQSASYCRGGMDGHTDG